MNRRDPEKAETRKGLSQHSRRTPAGGPRGWSALRPLRLCGLFWLLFALSGQAAERQVLAFYYNWYGTPEFQSGRWLHWDECRGCTHNPEKTIEAVSPRDGRKLVVPDTGTKNHPGRLYDSTDPARIREHLNMAEWAGLDAFIVTWWGRGLFHDRALRTALDVARDSGSPVKFTIYYETIPRGAADPVAAVVDDFRYLRQQYASHPAFFRYQGKPVFFLYGRAMNQMSEQQWRGAAAGIRALGSSVLMADGLKPNWVELFDGVHEYNPVGRVVEKADMLARYKNTVALCRPREKVSTSTVIPGYNDSNIGRPRPIVADREGGKLYQRLWQAALDAGPDWVLITSFNEWHEGSEIEPSREWGDFFLNLTRDYALKFKGNRR